MLTIDGAMGEGGGQVLRSSLALAVITGRPVHLFHVRAGREKPGLQPQHLQAVRAAADICGGQVEGANLGSREISFIPGPIHGGRYRFDIGTAGSAPLVLQTIFLPLSQARDSSQVTITGGTHLPHAPCSDYLERQWLPLLQALGFRARLSTLRAGFYPQGGGEIQALIRPARQLQPLERMERGKLIRIRGLSAVANLSADISKRQKLQALRRLEPLCRDSKIETVDLPSPGKGTVLLLLAAFEYATACYFSLGAIGKRAELVADEAVDALQTFLQTGAAIDEYLADQLILPLAMTAAAGSGPSHFTTPLVTRHLLTQAALIPLFLPVIVQVEGDEGQTGSVHVLPA